MVRLYVIAAFTLLVGALPCFAAEKLAVIVNKSNANPVDQVTVQKIYQAKKLRWSVGGAVQVIDLAENSPLTAHFYSKLVGRPYIETKELWSLRVFTGAGMPPQVLSNDAEVKRIVADNRNAIGYIKAASVDPSVKVAFYVE